MIPKHTPDHYRADIDGIRGLAILSVLAFHLNSKILPTGYTGVDFFFVISGFLISGIILNGIQNSSFNLIEFYSKRVRRIFPSLILVFFSVCLFGWLFLFPDEFQALGKHVFAGAGFCSNILLWKESGYFDGAAALKPLLNLWSLGIEEQFYLVWPLTLILITRLKIDFFKFVVFAMIVSFAWSLFLTYSSPTSAFYLPWTRFWELMLGASLVKIQDVHLFKKMRFNHDWLSAGGLLLFVLSVCGIVHSKFYPGFWALIPTLAAALFILAGPTAWINKRILGSSFLVFFGQISYPLYLWHWPLLSLNRILTGAGERFFYTEAGIVMFSIFVAWLSARFIEDPIRFGKNKSVKMTAVIFLSMMAFVVIGFAMQQQLIKPRLTNVKTENISQAINDWEYSQIGFKHNKIMTHQLQGSTDDTVLFLGDSHMEQYWPRFEYLYKTKPQKMTTVFATYDGCLPLPNYHKVSTAANDSVKCDTLFDVSMKMAFSPKVKRVVFDGFWDNGEIKRSDFDRAVADLEIRLNALHESGKETFIVLSNPTGPAFHPHNMRISRRNGKLMSGGDYFDEVEFRQRTKDVSDKLKDVATKTGTKIIDPLDFMCTSNKCPVSVDEKPIYLDEDHMRPFYAREFASFMDVIISNPQ